MSTLSRVLVLDARTLLTRRAPRGRTDNKVAPGTVGAAKLVRTWAGLSMSGDVVDVESFDPQSQGTDIYLASMDLEVRLSTWPPSVRFPTF